MIVAVLIGTVILQERTVTFTHPCAHSSVVLEAFGKEIGETIKIGGSVDKDYFLVRFDDMPVEDAKAAIAKALNATWRKSGETLYLTRTRAQERAEENAIQAELLSEINRQIQEAVKRNKKRRAFTMEYLNEEMRDLSQEGRFSSFLYAESPSRRFQDRVLSAMTSDALLALSLGKTLYSSSPVTDEYPMPSNWEGFLQTFKEESEMWGLALDINAGDSRGLNFASYVPGRTVKIEIDRARTSISHTLQIVHRSGGAYMGFGKMEGGGGNGSEWPKFYEPLAGKASVSQDMQEAWSVKSAQDTRYYDSSRPKLRKKTEHPRLLTLVMSDVSANDPLTTLNSWPILDAAEEHAVNIVALLPDELQEWSNYVQFERDISLRQVFRGPGTGLYAKYDDELSCWLARPANPVLARENRLDRTEFDKLLQTASAQGWLRLDDVAQFISRTGITTLSTGWVRWLNRAIYSDHSWLINFTQEQADLATQVYSLLAPTVRSQAWRGGVEVPLRNWPQGVVQALRGEDWDEERLLPAGAEPYSREARQGRTAEALFRERLPVGTTLQVEVVTSERLWVAFDDTGMPMDLHSYVFYLTLDQAKRPDKYDLDKLAVGITEELVVRVNVPGVGSIAFAARFERKPLDSELGPIEKLPASLRSAISEAIGKARSGGHKHLSSAHM